MHHTVSEYNAKGYKSELSFEQKNIKTLKKNNYSYYKSATYIFSSETTTSQRQRYQHLRKITYLKRHLRKKIGHLKKGLSWLISIAIQNGEKVTSMSFLKTS